MKTKQQLMEEMLFEAVKENNVEEVRGLLALGISPNTKDKSGNIPLSYFPELYNLSNEIIRLLVEAGSDVNIFTAGEPKIPLAIAITSYFKSDVTIEMLDFFIKHGLNVNFKMKDGFTPLHEAVFQREYNVVEFLIRKGADVNARYSPCVGVSLTPIDLTYEENYKYHYSPNENGEYQDVGWKHILEDNEVDDIEKNPLLMIRSMIPEAVAERDNAKKMQFKSEEEAIKALIRAEMKVALGNQK
jgi:ankyrin repeat protein